MTNDDSNKPKGVVTHTTHQPKEGPGIRHLTEEDLKTFAEENPLYTTRGAPRLPLTQIPFPLGGQQHFTSPVGSSLGPSVVTPRGDSVHENFKTANPGYLLPAGTVTIPPAQHVTCTRAAIGWDMGHRLVRHSGHCGALHGHRYTLEVTCAAVSGKLDDVGLVIDFSVIKREVEGWIKATLDHRTVLERGDYLIHGILRAEAEDAQNQEGALTGADKAYCDERDAVNTAYDEGFEALGGTHGWYVRAGKHLTLVDFSPSAEHLVQFIVTHAQRLLTPHGVKVIHARLYETVNCYVEWSARPVA